MGMAALSDIWSVHFVHGDVRERGRRGGDREGGAMGSGGNHTLRGTVG